MTSNRVVVDDVMATKLSRTRCREKINSYFLQAKSYFSLDESSNGAEEKGNYWNQMGAVYNDPAFANVYRRKFIRMLAEAHTQTLDDWSKGKITSNEAFTIAVNTMDLAGQVSKLNRDSIKTNIEDYRQAVTPCLRTPLLAKVIGGLIGAVLGLIAGAMIGMATGPGAALTALYGGVNGAVIGASLGGSTGSVAGTWCSTWYQRRKHVLTSLGNIAEELSKLPSPRSA